MFSWFRKSKKEKWLRVGMSLSPAMQRELEMLRKRFQLEDNGQVFQRAIQIFSFLKDKKIFYEEYNGNLRELDIYSKGDEKETPNSYS